MRPSTYAWPPGRSGYPTCPACGQPVTTDPGAAGVIPIEGGLVGRYAHKACVISRRAATSITEEPIDLNQRCEHGYHPPLACPTGDCRDPAPRAITEEPTEDGTDG